MSFLVKIMSFHKGSFLFFIIPFFMSDNKKTISYLALGDSYTIGESLPFAANFPSQTVSLLEEKAINVKPLDVVAKTGWTTDELSNAIDNASLKKTYDIVSLLIGVNNQYRGRPLSEYNDQFESLLQRAVKFAGGRKERVVVLSIPDWGVTPYAAGRDKVRIALDIDSFNNINRELSAKYGVHYIDITPLTRAAAVNPSLLAEDGLHPSAKAYLEWARLLAERFRTVLAE
jgi:lysophospholipase L1-like esterase